MKPKFLILALLLLVVPMISAGEMPPVKQGDDVLLRQTCGSCSYVNISVYYPNSTKAIDNQAMTNVGGGYWEYEFSNTTALGKYDYPTCGDISGVHTCSDSQGLPYFEVTPNGNSSNNSNITFFIFVILLIYGITFTGFFGKNIPITILGGMAMIFLGVYLVNNGVIIYRDNLTNYIAYLTIAIGAILSLWAGLEQLEVI